MSSLGLVGKLRHEERLRRPRQDLLKRAAIAVAGGVLVPDFVFVVVIPDGGDAVIKECGLDPVSPPGASARIGEIDVEAKAVPELRDSGLAGLAIPDENILLPRLVKARMVIEKAGLEIGDGLHARLLQPSHGCSRVREFLPVPIERVAPWTDRGVAGPEVKAVTGNLVMAALLDVIRNSRIRVGRVRDRHRG